MMKDSKLEARVAELEALLEAKETEQTNFVRSVTHSLKNSLGLVNNFARMAQLDGADTADEGLQDSLRTVVKNGKMALHIVEELRLWAAVKNGTTIDPASYAIHPIIDNVWEHCDDLVHFGRASLQMDEVPADTTILGDKALITQVVLAVISFLLGRGERPNRIICAVKENESDITLFLSGNFDRELDLSPLFVGGNGVVKTDGYGLGLPFARQLMHLMNGEISCAEPADGRLCFALRWGHATQE